MCFHRQLYLTPRRLLRFVDENPDDYHEALADFAAFFRYRSERTTNSNLRRRRR
jgi:hypothetical protein